MRYYIIYKNDHFIGYTTNKNYLNNFLNNRKDKFTITKLKENDIPEEIRNSFEFSNYELTEYTNYYTDNDTILFNHEMIEMEDLIIDDLVVLESLLEKILEFVKCMKFTDNEKEFIRIILGISIDEINSHLSSNEIVFDEIIKIRKYFYDRYLPHKRIQQN